MSVVSNDGLAVLFGESEAEAVDLVTRLLMNMRWSLDLPVGEPPVKELPVLEFEELSPPGSPATGLPTGKPSVEGSPVRKSPVRPPIGSLIRTSPVRELQPPPVRSKRQRLSESGRWRKN